MTLSRRHALAAAAAAALAFGLAGCERRPPPHHFNSIDLSGAKYARGFDLPDFDGRRRTLGEFKDKVVAVFFGYTQCPDACPTTMAAFSAVEKALGPQASKLQVIFITVDPARDTAALLKNYVTNFNPGFLALRGDDAQTKAVTAEYKVFYEKVPGPTPDSYTMDHTAGTYIYDPQGRLRLFAPQGLSPEQFTADIQALLAEPADA
ncbi:MAG TPA: SCO family protein [Burkholderiaceae bacterium]